MLIRDRKHPGGYHVDRHPPSGAERVIDPMVLLIAAVGCGLVLFLMRYSNFL